MKSNSITKVTQLSKQFREICRDCGHNNDKVAHFLQLYAGCRNKFHDVIVAGCVEAIRCDHDDHVKLIAPHLHTHEISQFCLDILHQHPPQPKSTKIFLILFSQRLFPFDINQTIFDLVVKFNRVELIPSIIKRDRSVIYRRHIIDACDHDHPEMLQVLLDHHPIYIYNFNIFHFIESSVFSREIRKIMMSQIKDKPISHSRHLMLIVYAIQLNHQTMLQDWPYCVDVDDYFFLMRRFGICNSSTVQLFDTIGRKFLTEPQVIAFKLFACQFLNAEMVKCLMSIHPVVTQQHVQLCWTRPIRYPFDIQSLVTSLHFLLTQGAALEWIPDDTYRQQICRERQHQQKCLIVCLRTVFHASIVSGMFCPHLSIPDLKKMPNPHPQNVAKYSSSTLEWDRRYEQEKTKVVNAR